MRLFIKKINTSLFQRGKSNLTTHGIIHLYWPVADHVIPWSKGGLTNLENLVSSCATCNYGKAGYTIEQLGIENPFRIISEISITIFFDSFLWILKASDKPNSWFPKRPCNT